MSCSANSDRPRKIESCIQAANTVLTQFDRATIFVNSFGALCSSTYVQAVSLENIYIYIYIYISVADPRGFRGVSGNPSHFCKYFLCFQKSCKENKLDTAA